MDEASFLYFMDHCQISDEYTQTGCTILMDTTQNQLVLMKQIELNEDDNVDNMIDILHKQKELYHEHLLSLIDFYPAITEGKMVKFYEYCSHTLLQEIQSRIELDNPFTQEELENILVSGLKLLQYLQESEIGHGCISPLDICLADDLVKIVDPSIASSNPFSIVEGYYYSPELLQSITKNSQEDVEIFKNDVFSLAVCILHCGLLASCHDCYDYESGQFIFQNLEEKVEQFNEMYSEKLVRVLIRMLDEDSDTRPTSTEALLLIEKEFEQKGGEGHIANRELDFQEYQEPQYAKTYNRIPSQQNKPQSIPPKIHESKHKNNENSSSLANMSETQKRLASMIARAKMNISRLKEKNSDQPQ